LALPLPDTAANESRATGTGVTKAVTDKTPPSGYLSFMQLRQLWLDNGGAPNFANEMAAIALAESYGDPGALAAPSFVQGANPNHWNVTNGEDSRGLWQINTRAHPQYLTVNLFDPAVNVAAAIDILQGSGPGAWSTYTNGAYLKYLPSNAPPDATYTGPPEKSAPSLLNPFGITGVTGGQQGGSNPLTGLPGKALSGVEKYVVYGLAVFGGVMLMLLGLILIGVDLGIASRNSVNPIAARNNRRAEADSQAQDEARAEQARIKQARSEADYAHKKKLQAAVLRRERAKARREEGARPNTKKKAKPVIATSQGAIQPATGDDIPY
jgi:hypothetical protein